MCTECKCVCVSMGTLSRCPQAVSNTIGTKLGAVNMVGADSPSLHNATGILTLHEGCLTVKSFLELENVSVDCIEKVKKLDVADPQLRDIIPNGITDCLQTLTNLSQLRFSGNKLKSITSEIANLQKLEYLDISNNKLIEIPEEIGNLVNLKSFNVSNNLLNKIPATILDLEKLSHLNISGNNLQFLPEAMGKLAQMCNLDVSNNKLEDLPESLAHLDNLKTFNVSANQIKGNLPACFFMGMKNITTLDLSRNALDNLRALPLCATQLKRLNLSHNSMMLVPEWMCVSCGSLEEIDLSYNNQLSGMAEDPKNLYVYGGGIRSTLKRVNISACKLTSKTTDFLGSFKNLVELHAGNEHMLGVRKTKQCVSNVDCGNMFWDIPVSILPHASYLTVLCLPAVGLSVLPDNISELQALQVLDLRSNELHYLNNEFCQLTSLNKVMLSDNYLQALPLDIGTLQGLAELYVDGNQISSLPQSFSMLKHLVCLDLYDNCLGELIPDWILNLSFLKGLDLEQNNMRLDNVVKSVPLYEELRCQLRSRGTAPSSRVDGPRHALQEDVASDEEDDYEDSVRSYGSSSPGSKSGHASDVDDQSTEDSELQISPADSNWDSPIEDESDWTPTECVYVNVATKFKTNVNPPSILCKKTFVKPNLFWQAGQFDTDSETA